MKMPARDYHPWTPLPLFGLDVAVTSALPGVDFCRRDVCAHLKNNWLDRMEKFGLATRQDKAWRIDRTWHEACQGIPAPRKVLQWLHSRVALPLLAAFPQVTSVDDLHRVAGVRDKREHRPFLGLQRDGLVEHLRYGWYALGPRAVGLQGVIEGYRRLLAGPASTGLFCVYQRGAEAWWWSRSRSPALPGLARPIWRTKCRTRPGFLVYRGRRRLVELDVACANLLAGQRNPWNKAPRQPTTRHLREAMAGVPLGQLRDTSFHHASGKAYLLDLYGLADFRDSIIEAALALD